MNYCETIREMKDTVTINSKEDYFNAESTLTNLMCVLVKGAKVTSLQYGFGMVTETAGDTFADIVLTISFAKCIKKFSLYHLIVKGRFLKFEDSEIYEVWAEAFELHDAWTITYQSILQTERQLAIEAEKEAEARRKAEIRYQKAKEKALVDFQELVARPKETMTHVDVFYYTLGWLTAHIGTFTAAMPDYLEHAFVKHFGPEAPHRAVDSRKKTVNGFPTQWALSFRASLPRAINIPTMLTQYLNPTGNAITNTAFLWDLIESYGFQFGKKQDQEKIEACIPVQYLTVYRTGLAD